MYKIFLEGKTVTLVESSMLSKPWPDENGELKYRCLLDKETGIVYVPRLYPYIFAVEGITAGAKRCGDIALAKIFHRIDRITHKNSTCILPVI